MSTTNLEEKPGTWLGLQVELGLATETLEKADAVVWLEAESLQVRTLDLIPVDAGLTHFSRGLLEAMHSGEFPPPGRLLVEAPEQLVALGGVAELEGIPVEVDQGATALASTSIRPLLEQLKEGPGYGYLLNGDIDPDRVGEFFRKVDEFYDLEPPQGYLVIEGITPEPLYADTFSPTTVPSLRLYYSADFYNQISSGLTDAIFSLSSLFLTQASPKFPHLALQLEVLCKKWVVHPLGLPMLLNLGRPERVHPTADELELTISVLDHLIAFLDPDPARPVSDVVMEWFEPEERYPVPEASHQLDARVEELWSQGEPYQAIGLARRSLRLTATSLRRQRLADLYFRLGLYDQALSLWSAFREDKTPEWQAVGALCECRVGHLASGRRLLKKVLKKAPDLGGRLLHVGSQDEFSKRWRGHWQACPEAIQALQELAMSRV
ncbi:MAG: hypothetical protein KC910_18870 [Candidatus Eremiobacteraeota bacterium]|nr:hypothetical protein [Candidatus Eremiobacteraeota bacterium]